MDEEDDLPTFDKEWSLGGLVALAAVGLFVTLLIAAMLAQIGD